jgi:hypothetical protein
MAKKPAKSVLQHYALKIFLEGQKKPYHNFF